MKGYGKVGKFRAHRVVWEAANGPVPTGMVVRHACDNPPCVRLSHLVLGTQAQNVQDAIIRHRERNKFPRGEKHPNSKLTDAQVAEIRGLIEEYTYEDIAEMYGVSKNTIYHIRNGRTHKS